MYQKSILKRGEILAVLSLMLILNITGCSNEKADKASETSSVSVETLTEINTETESVSPSEMAETSVERHSIEDENILKVLENKEKYFNTELQEYCYLKNYSSGNYMYMDNDGKYKYWEESWSENFKIDCWCEVDMDSDGNKEIVLITSKERVLVLHSEDDIVYCYAFPVRGMKCIKTDGSFESSGSAVITYVGKIKFVDGECIYDEMCAMDIDELDDEKIVYRVNKKDADREAFETFKKEQDKKEEVLWIDGYPSVNN